MATEARPANARPIVVPVYSAPSYSRRAVSARRLLALLAIFFATLLFGATLGGGLNPIALLLLAAGALAVPFIWQRPALGVYIIVGATAAIEAYNLGYP